MNFETPNHQSAYFAGMSIEQFEASIDAQVAEMEALEDAFRPDVEREVNRYVRESDMFDPDTVWTVERVDAEEDAFLGR